MELDEGCSINKVILSLNEVLDKVSNDTFIIIETKISVNLLENVHKELGSCRKIVDVYFCDQKVIKIDSPSKYVAI